MVGFWIAEAKHGGAYFGLSEGLAGDGINWLHRLHQPWEALETPGLYDVKASDKVGALDWIHGFYRLDLDAEHARSTGFLEPEILAFVEAASAALTHDSRYNDDGEALKALLYLSGPAFREAASECNQDAADLREEREAAKKAEDEWNAEWCDSGDSGEYTVNPKLRRGDGEPW